MVAELEAGLSVALELWKDGPLQADFRALCGPAGKQTQAELGSPTLLLVLISFVPCPPFQIPKWLVTCGPARCGPNTALIRCKTLFIAQIWPKTRPWRWSIFSAFWPPVPETHSLLWRITEAKQMESCMHSVIRGELQKRSRWNRACIRLYEILSNVLRNIQTEIAAGASAGRCEN